VLLGNGDGTFRPAVNVAVGSRTITIADDAFDADGHLDLAVANNSGLGNVSSVSILLGDGTGGFSSRADYTVGLSCFAIAAADFKGDGKLDLVTANHSGDVSVLLGNGDGTFQSAHGYAAGSGPTGVVCGDFNGDGKLDLAVSNFYSQDVSVLRGNGNGTIQAAVSYPVGATVGGSGPTGLALADLNGDHQPDLVTANHLNGTISIFMGNPDGTFQSPVLRSVGTAPVFVTAADLNGDGEPDLVVSVDVDNTVAVLVNNQVPTTIAQTITWSNPAPIIVGTPLSGTQLNATVSVVGPAAAGTLTYSPAAGAVLDIGTQILTVSAAATKDYSAATASVPIRVLYNFSGFEIPYLAALKPGTKFGLGTTVNLEFQLHDANGSLISTIAPGTALQVALVQADGGLGTPFTPASLSNKGLFWDSTNDHFNWVTKGLAAGTYQLILTLADGTVNTTTVQLVSQQGTAKAESALGSDSGLDSSSATSGLLLGDLYVIVNDPNGTFSPDELARIQDAITSIDQVLGPYHVQISEVSDPSAANLVIDSGTTSASGTAADGVLGCFDAAHMEVTMLQGWDWYAGADPSQIGAGQYDFQTTVTHELGHALGLGGNSDATSPMNESLPPGMVRRTLLVADLNVPQDDAGADALHAIVPEAPSRRLGLSLRTDPDATAWNDQTASTVTASGWSAGERLPHGLGEPIPDAFREVTPGGTDGGSVAYALATSGLTVASVSPADGVVRGGFGPELLPHGRAADSTGGEARSRLAGVSEESVRDENRPIAGRLTADAESRLHFRAGSPVVETAMSAWGTAWSSARERAFVELAAPMDFENATSRLGAGDLTLALALALPLTAAFPADGGRENGQRTLPCAGETVVN
jgi:hypothetical protein